MKSDKDKFSEYFVAIVPPSPLYDDAHQLKLYFQERYNSKAALRSPPHITLHMPFQWKPQKETQLVESLQAFAREVEPFRVHVDNFACFPPRVIFLNIVNNEKLEALQRELKKHFKRKLNIFNADYRDKPFHPHLTIAFRDLKKAAFVEAWNEFKSREHKSAFVVDKITLLKHDGKQWNVLKAADMRVG